MIDSKKEKMLTARGVVTEALPSTLFRVEIGSKEEEKKRNFGLFGRKNADASD